MLKIGSKPILEHIIENAKSQGYKNFLISINYLGEIIKNYFMEANLCKYTILKKKNF